MSFQPFTKAAALDCIRERFGAEPEYLWRSDPDSAAIRRADNRKWFAVLLRVPRSRLGLPGEGDADILDLKCDPLLIGALRAREGFLPAYHMNKERWITVLLDGQVDTTEGAELLDMSYQLAGPKPKARRRAAREDF